MPRLEPTGPTIVIAYGRDGLAWLAQLRDSLGSGRSWSALVEDLADGVVQYWAVGIDPDEFGDAMRGITAIDSDAGAEHLRQLLDQGRSAELLQSYGDYRVNEVLILERFSPFGVSAETRYAVHHSLDIGRRNRFQDGATTLVTYEWVALCDVVRPAAPLDADGEEEVRAHFRSQLPEVLTLLVDQANSQGAIQSDLWADQTFSHVARGLLRYRLAGGVDLPFAGIHLDLDRKPSDVVHAVSVAVYRHSGEDLAALADRELGSRLGRGAVQLNDASTSPTLGQAIRSELGRVPTVARLSDLERERAVAAALTAGLTSRLRHLPEPWKPLDEAFAELDRVQLHSAAPSPLEDSNAQTDTGEGSILSRLVRWLSTFFGVSGPGEPRPTDQVGAGRPNLAREHWATLLDAAESVRAAWGAWRAPVSSAGEAPWSREQAHYRLSALPPGLRLEDEISEQALDRVVLHCLRLALRGFNGAAQELVSESIRSMARELEFKGSVEEELIELSLKAIPEDGTHRWPPLSVYAGAPPPVHQVMWFTESRVPRDAIQELEKGVGNVLDANVVLMPILSPEETLRIAVSGPIPRDQILSLHPTDR